MKNPEMTNQRLHSSSHSSQSVSEIQTSRVLRRQCSYQSNTMNPNRIHESLDAESRKALANFFCEGYFRHEGCINSENVFKYLAISRQLHHEQLKLECENFLSNSENLCSRLPIHPRTEGEASRYQVMFPRNKDSIGPLTVHVCDFRNNLQKSCNVQELKHVGDGYAFCCSQQSEKDAPHVYVSGGNGCFGDVYQFDIVMNKRKKCSKKLINGRSYHCMKCVQRNLYVFGGYNKKGETVTVIEEFAPKRRSWATVGKLEIGVHSATSVVHDNQIYIFGGITDSGEETRAVQRFDPITRSCVRLSSLPCPVSEGQAVVRKDKIYIACSNGRLISYDPASDVHVVCTNMPVRCSNFGMFVEREGIFFTGGLTRNNNSQHKKVFVYSPENCTWHVIDKELSSPLSLIGSCTVEIPATYGFVPFFN